MTNQLEHDEIDDGSAEGGGATGGSGVQNKKSKVPMYVGIGVLILVSIGIISSLVS